MKISQEKILIPSTDELVDGTIVMRTNYFQSTSDLAKHNLVHVIMQRMLGSLDEEQARQALDVLNGVSKQE